jgi:AcrR family transcriptional regulator
VAESQRWRLLGAAAQVLAECGYAGTSSRAIASAASVSSATFYIHFENVDACLLAAYEMAAECLLELVSAACTGTGEWLERLRRAVAAAIGFLVSEPALARLLAADAPAGIAPVAASRQHLIERLAGLLCSGRELRIETADELAPGTERRLIAAALSLLGDRVVAGELDLLPSLAPELTEILAGPYLGTAAAD